MLGLAALLGPGCTGNIERATPQSTVENSSPAAESPGWSDTPTDCTAPTAPVEAPLRRLTRGEYGNAVVALLEGPPDLGSTLPPDEPAGPFAANRAAPVSVLAAEKLMLAAEAASAVALPGLLSDLPCVEGPDLACMAEFIRDFGRRAYRRPLTEDEADDQLALFEELRDELDPSSALQAVIERFLQSPYFLYALEEGVDAPGSPNLQELSPYALAARLAAFLWQSIPDDALLDAAATGKLATVEGLRAEALRLFAEPPARAAVADFHEQLLGISNLELVEKNAGVHPEFGPGLAAAMAEETSEFVQTLLLDRELPVADLLRSRWASPKGPLAELYGVPAGPPLELPADVRYGILTHPSFLTVHAHADQSSVVKRGKIVRTALLCQELPTPPANVNDVVQPPTADTTTRERLEQHRSDPACAGCHVLIDEFGFAFEAYDAIGRFRSFDGPSPVDTSGNVVGTSFDGAYQGAPELMEKLATSPEFSACMVTQWFRYALRRRDTTEDACALHSIAETWTTSGGRLADLVIALVQSESFRYRPRPVLPEDMP